jgi:hypothetical protein
MTLLTLLVGSAAMKMPHWVNESLICAGGLCEKPDMKYERIADIQPGYQWDDAGGYCGSWASQRAILSKGAWISQQAVRDHTVNCGGHDEEILSCNIDEALTNLKISYEGFDYKDTPLPQTTEYAMWLKKQLVAGHTVAWMIMWSGQTYPIYNLTPPAGMYGHVEPVIGIQSNHPLNDTTVYTDDVVVHYTDGGVKAVYRPISTLPGKWAGVGTKADCGDYHYCISYPYGFGWAVKGFAPDPNEARAVSASLKIHPWMREPDTRSGEKPEALKGTLTATGLTKGASYDIYRWDTVGEALTYQDKYKKASFTATSDTYIYKDDKSFESDGTTYYRVVRAA